MDPLKTFCPNPDCPARGRIGEGNIKVHDRKRLRYRCGVCGRTFSEREGTAFYRLHVSSAVVALVLTLAAHGCPISAIVAAFGFQERTVRSWIEKAGTHCEAVHEHLVETPMDLEQVQADELRIKLQKEKGKPLVVWAAMALAVPCRLWLGVCDSPIRDAALARAILARVIRAAKAAPILFATDGWIAYKEAARRAFRTPARSGGRGRPRLIAWAGRVLGMVVKRTKKKRVVEVSRRLLEGTEADLNERLKASQGGGTLNTSYIERLNASFRARLFCLVRRTRALARRPAFLHAGLFLIGTVYNFCSYHDSLAVESGFRTPAMAAGIADHRWSVEELLSYRIPPPRWTPPKRRGRRPKRLLELIERWAT